MCLFKSRKKAAKEEQPQNKSSLPKNSYFTSESVSRAHPDLVCDTIADAIKDYYLEHDSRSRVAVEVLVTTQYVLLAGEVTSTVEKLPYISIVKDVLRRAGYTKLNKGFDIKNVRIYSRIHNQSVDIARGTNEDANGAGDIGIIFGYACSETETLIPLSWKMARDLTDQCFHISQTHPEMLCPDCKAQVTVKYQDGFPIGIDTVVVSASHEDKPYEEVVEFVKEKVIAPVLATYGYELSDVGRIYVNGTGRFVSYGPDADTGVTGRKLIVNQYGGHSAIGGGSMQGKDSSKVDLSAALMARYLAKNVVAAGLASKCQVQLAYCIGRPNPVSINVNCFGTESVPVEKIEKYFHTLDCSPKGIINRFDLNFNTERTFFYEDCSAHGWFGRDDVDLPWESDDLNLELIDWSI